MSPRCFLFTNKILKGLRVLLVEDEDKHKELPNLDYKIMQGNILIESYILIELGKISFDDYCFVCRKLLFGKSKLGVK